MAAAPKTEAITAVLRCFGVTLPELSVVLDEVGVASAVAAGAREAEEVLPTCLFLTLPSLDASGEAVEAATTVEEAVAAVVVVVAAAVVAVVVPAETEEVADFTVVVETGEVEEAVDIEIDVADVVVAVEDDCARLSNTSLMLSLHTQPFALLVSRNWTGLNEV
jgi:hypothetical protein